MVHGSCYILEVQEYIICTTCNCLGTWCRFRHVAQEYLHHLHLIRYLLPLQLCGLETSAPLHLLTILYMHHLQLLRYRVPGATSDTWLRDISIHAPPALFGYRVPGATSDTWLRDICTIAPAQVPGECFRDVAQGHQQ